MTHGQSTPDGNTSANSTANSNANISANPNNLRTGRYRIFLLTCWLEDQAERGDPAEWRFRLEEPRSGLRRGCVGVQRLLALLCDEIADEVVSVSTSVEEK